MINVACRHLRSDIISNDAIQILEHQQTWSSSSREREDQLNRVLGTTIRDQISNVKRRNRVFAVIQAVHDRFDTDGLAVSRRTVVYLTFVSMLCQRGWACYSRFLSSKALSAVHTYLGCRRSCPRRCECFLSWPDRGFRCTLASVHHPTIVKALT